MSENLEASNCEVLQRLNSGLEGVDVAPPIRAAVAGDMSTVAPQLVAELVALSELFDPDLEIDTSGLDMPGFGVLRGPKAMRDLWTRWIEDWEHYGWIQSNRSEVGEHVIADVEVQATGASSGADVVWTQCQVWTFRDGKVVRWSLFKNRAEALKAVGLAE
jgi:ketosteroid isomerase-like protein